MPKKNENLNTQENAPQQIVPQENAPQVQNTSGPHF